MRSICAFADLPFEPAMLEFAGNVDVSAKPHHQRLLQPPTRGVREWREQMSAADVEAFEAVAGDLLSELGYEVRTGRAPADAAGEAALGWYRAHGRVERRRLRDAALAAAPPRARGATRRWISSRPSRGSPARAARCGPGRR